MKKNKQDIITFKVDAPLFEAMKKIPNRSEFIRNAIFSALESACPLCHGTGVLSPRQKVHLDKFLKSHTLEECTECHEMQFICFSEREKNSQTDKE